MYQILACLTLEHDYWLVAAAAVVCVLGSVLTVQLSMRVADGQGIGRRLKICLTALIGGVTIWSTHFIAMLAYQPGVDHGYEPILTAGSLVVAVAGLVGAKHLLSDGQGAMRYLGGGGAFGFSVATMHYIGMSAYLLPGAIVWDFGLVLTSVALGSGLGALCYYRIVAQTGRFGWVGSAGLMVAAICAMHFSSMGAITIALDPRIAVPPAVLSDLVLTVVVMCVTAMILFVGFVALLVEKSIEREARDAIQRSTTHDALTGLPNRILLNAELDKIGTQLTTHPQSHLAVLTMDLNRFKEINDIFGHQTGDFILREVARRLSDTCTAGELVARTGGDEFIALKSDLTSADAAQDFAERLRDAVAAPLQLGEEGVVVRMAIGIATSVVDGRDLDGLLQKSDLAKYRAKSVRTDGICSFDPELERATLDRICLTDHLRRAIDQDELELYYQVQNDVATGDPIGFEALLRWNHPKRGMVSPGVFIPLAEETGLIQDIGRWVLRTACQEAATWAQPFSVAVNVAPQQLVADDFVDHLRSALAESALPPERLEIEITEASVIADKAQTLAVMHQIKAMGVRTAMDDFGTGYSSLATLQAFPYDKIKIDRSFVTDVHITHQRAAIVKATLLIGEALAIPVLAEGVETEGELMFLKSVGCHYVQGYYFGKPVSRDEIAPLVNPVALTKAS